MANSDRIRQVVPSPVPSRVFAVLFAPRDRQPALSETLHGPPASRLVSVSGGMICEHQFVTPRTSRLSGDVTGARRCSSCRETKVCKFPRGHSNDQQRRAARAFVTVNVTAQSADEPLERKRRHKRVPRQLIVLFSLSYPRVTRSCFIARSRSPATSRTWQCCYGDDATTYHIATR